MAAILGVHPNGRQLFRFSSRPWILRYNCTYYLYSQLCSLSLGFVSFSSCSDALRQHRQFSCLLWYFTGHWVWIIYYCKISIILFHSTTFMLLPKNKNLVSTLYADTSWHENIIAFTFLQFTHSFSFRPCHHFMHNTI